MDQAERTYREDNPKERASILSKIFFCFTAPILKKGHKKDLQEQDIYNVLSKFKSDGLGDVLEKRYRRRNSVFRAILEEFGWIYLGLGFLQLIMRTAVIFLQPRAVSKFVDYFEKKGDKTELFYYASFVIAINLINCIYNHNYQLMIMEYAVRIRTALCSLIYRKALRLSPALNEGAMGKVVTLMTKDVYSIDGALLFINDMWIGVIQTVIITVMIFQIIGWSVFAGIGFFLLMIPIQSYCGRKFSLTRLVAAKKAEERIQLVKEALSAIKILKMYSWETYFHQLITWARMKETDKLKIIYYLKATILTLGGLTMKLALFLLIITYTLMGKAVSAQTIYFIQQCFFALRSCITTSIPMGISNIAELSASMKRIQQYLDCQEFHALTTNTAKGRVFMDKVAVEISGQHVLKSISMDVNEGLLIITGNLGSGKSVLLKTLLGEYKPIKGQLNVQGTLSYAPEQPWLFPSTIRQNILFGQQYNENRYKEVLRVCALNHDLNVLKKQDNTVVGDKGVNLSKGQQARICLARAVYREADVYLLDDCLSALDARVNNHVFKECIRSFLQHKIVILVNNNVNNLKQVPTGNILVLDHGRSLDLDQQKAALDKRITYYIDEDDQYLFQDESESDTEETDQLLPKKPNTEPRRNLYHEDKKEGSVLWRNYKTYYQYTGGMGVLVFTIVLFISCQAAITFSDKLLSQWVNLEAQLHKNNTNETSLEKIEDKKDYTLKIYGFFVIFGTILTLLRSFSNFYFCTKAGRKLHAVLVDGVLNACMSFFDNHYIGNIVNRVSKDFHTIDESIPFIIYEVLRSFFVVVFTMIVIVLVNLYFLIPALLLFIVLFCIQNYYIPTGRSLKRLEAATRSPMVGYINASLEGLSTVHAYKEEKILRYEFDRHQDHFTSAFYMNQTTVRTFAFALDMMCVAFIAGIVIGLALFPDRVEVGDVGLAVTQAMGLIGLLQWAIRQAAEMENTMTSVERVLEYAHADQEDRHHGQKLTNWPKSGSICYKSVSLTYKSTGDEVLKNITFKIDAGSKIGIIGRTGAGKSSIISLLFRLYEYTGTITIDGVDISKLSLDHLRQSIGIIPQDPILFTGTIRANIDPLNQYTDEEIWSAIGKVQLKPLVADLSHRQVDFSSGQRQLLCLARALICKHKIIVLDEATANMDRETDKMIQKTIQDHFVDCTVITIAHRLESFQIVDKILVVEEGRVVQFDSPSVLLGDSEGVFWRMVREAGGIHFL